MSKPAIPALQGIQDGALLRVLTPIKENIELLNGIRGGVLAALPADATLSAVIAKLNEVIARLNAH